jgi:hypothetical protein
VVPQVRLVVGVQLLPLFATHPEDATTVAVPGFGPVMIWKA